MKVLYVGACVAVVLSGCAQSSPGPGVSASNPQIAGAAGSGVASGTWSGTIAGQGPDAWCRGHIRMTVKDGRADGTYKIGYAARRPLTGSVDAAGAFRSDDGAGSGRFSGDGFAGDFSNTQSPPACGAVWRIRMSRETYSFNRARFGFGTNREERSAGS